jgi:hypothetical protein
MRVSVLRYPAGAHKDPKTGRTDDDDFLDALDRAVNRPPADHFFQDMKFAMAYDQNKLWQEVIIIYGEIPTNEG